MMFLGEKPHAIFMSFSKIQSLEIFNGSYRSLQNEHGWSKKKPVIEKNSDESIHSNTFALSIGQIGPHNTPGPSPASVAAATNSRRCQP
ncbi:hypothetical protein L2E82_39395 [Cichorium intybus]|uniref:Uncharacterized protein n=1 Tax=Cichorium intybus TaxID=13427 RepID=A0ACB9AJ28_CICIN|nr:hypothetical protein L2E82_39395 [Cichorium intybus]